MSWLSVVKEVLTPGSARYKAHVMRVTEEQARLVKCLHLLEDVTTRDIKSCTDEAAEFE